MITGRWEQAEQAENITTNHQWERQELVGFIEPQVGWRQRNNMLRQTRTSDGSSRRGGGGGRGADDKKLNPRLLVAMVMSDTQTNI